MTNLRICISLLFTLAGTQANAALILASSDPGTFGGQPPGVTLTSSFFIGWRFEVTTPVVIDTIGVGVYSGVGANGNFSITLLNLADSSSLPSGTPFSTGEVVLQDNVMNGFKAYDERQFLLSTPVSLSTGTYGLVLSTSSSNAGTLPNNNSDFSGTSYFSWNGTSWQNSGVSNIRLAAYGIPEPSTTILGGMGALILLTNRRRSKNPNKS